MKHPITIRLDPELLAAARLRAKEENRTLTNFLETALKQRFEASPQNPPSGSHESCAPGKSRRSSNGKP